MCNQIIYPNWERVNLLLNLILKANESDSDGDDDENDGAYTSPHSNCQPTTVHQLLSSPQTLGRTFLNGSLTRQRLSNRFHCPRSCCNPLALSLSQPCFGERDAVWMDAEWEKRKKVLFRYDKIC